MDPSMRIICWAPPLPVPSSPSGWWRSPRRRGLTPSATAVPEGQRPGAVRAGHQALCPRDEDHRPWRIWDIKGRDEEIDYAESHNVPLKISRETSYSKDKNLWHLSHEGLDLEDPANEPQYDKPGFLEMGVSPAMAPDQASLCDPGF